MTKGSRILVVEDEMVISMEIAATLKRFGYGIAGQVMTGEEAILLAREKQPDLILMDIRLSGEMDGIEAAARIADISPIPIIFLTAHSDERTLDRAIAVDPSGYLIKPFKDRELYSAVELALRRTEILQKMRLGPPVVPGGSPGGSPVPCLLTLTPDGRITHAACGDGTLFGSDAAALVGTAISDWLCLDDLRGLDRNGRICIRPDRVVVKGRHADRIPVTVRAGFLLDRDGSVQGYLLEITGACLGDR